MKGCSSATPPGQVYLDHAGTALPATEMMKSVCQELMTSSMGNPHSVGSQFGETTTNMVSIMRERVLQHFGLTYEEYDVVFTSGTTGSLNLVGQIFPWHNNISCVAHPMNAHTSLLGMRTYASKAFCFPSKMLYDRHENGVFSKADNVGLISQHCHADDDNLANFNLLLIPGECNFSGRKTNLELISKISTLFGDSLIECVQGCAVIDYHNDAASAKTGNNRSTVERQVPVITSSLEEDVIKEGQRGNRKQLHWMWLLDAAKLAATSAIDLSVLSPPMRPHFVCLSFYKIFGYPTGLGALLVRRDIAPLLQKRYYGGGTLQAAAADLRFAVPRSLHPHEYLEDGTCHFYGIAALRHGFDFIDKLGGMIAIEQYTYQLTMYLATSMQKLVHRASSISEMNVELKTTQNYISSLQYQGRQDNDRPLCQLYGIFQDSDHHHQYYQPTQQQQGSIVAFNLFWANGTPIGFAEVGARAAKASIQLRTGCFCNVGGCQEALQISAQESIDNYRLGRVCSENGFDVVNGKQTGAVRVSVGFTTTQQDCDVFLAFLRDTFLDQCPPPLATKPSIFLDSGARLSYGKIESIKTTISKLAADTITADSLSSPPIRIDEICASPQITPNFPVAMHSRMVASIDFAAKRNSSGNSNTTTATTTTTTTATVEPDSPPVILAAIFVYPIKSCAGMRVSAWPIVETSNSSAYESSDNQNHDARTLPTGLLHDRTWALVDRVTGQALTQKKYPKLALIRPYLDLQQGVMVVTAEGMVDTLVISLPPSPYITSDSSSFPTSSHLDGASKQRCSLDDNSNDNNNNNNNNATTTPSISTSADISICGQVRKGVGVSTDADDWFSRYLSMSGNGSSGHCIPGKSKVSCRLLRIDSLSQSSSSAPTSSSDTTTMRDKSGGVVPKSASFANTAQFLLISAESVRTLTQLILHSAGMNAHSSTSINNDKSSGNSSSNSSQLGQYDSSSSNPNARNSLNIKVENFRPNLLVTGGSGEPHQEDSWSKITFLSNRSRSVCPNNTNNENNVGDVAATANASAPSATIAAKETERIVEVEEEEEEDVFVAELNVTGPCPRCSMVNVDGASGTMDCRAFQALATYRRDYGDRQVYFGQFCSLVPVTLNSDGSPCASSSRNLLSSGGGSDKDADSHDNKSVAQSVKMLHIGMNVKVEMKN